METLMAAIMLWAPVLILLRRLTGAKALLFHLASGIPRFVVGVACAVFASITVARCHTMVLSHPCVYEVPGGFFVLPTMVLAALLLPLGFIQIVGSLLKKILRARAW